MQCFRYLKKRWKVGAPSCGTWEPAVWHGLWLGFHKTFSTFMLKGNMLLSSIENYMQKSVLNMNGIKYFLFVTFFPTYFASELHSLAFFKEALRGCGFWIFKLCSLLLWHPNSKRLQRIPPAEESRIIFESIFLFRVVKSNGKILKRCNLLGLTTKTLH